MKKGLTKVLIGGYLPDANHLGQVRHETLNIDKGIVSSVKDGDRG